ncbi:hypothetical protein OH76DRAFT_12300 [Lentinus brumalis]|uniref:Uncharacterized protein n=1 Tax=Lentinus brumalis TaxID=2498619 RepID=A0A371DX24_9APHY|nr:hypothetical protein OH76DRAFT_12300 [Polyporus brumalis]
MCTSPSGTSVRGARCGSRHGTATLTRYVVRSRAARWCIGVVASCRPRFDGPYSHLTPRCLRRQLSPPRSCRGWFCFEVEYQKLRVTTTPRDFDLLSSRALSGLSMLSRQAIPDPGVFHRSLPALDNAVDNRVREPMEPRGSPILLPITPPANAVSVRSVWGGYGMS